jgi:hypothetical protein
MTTLKTSECLNTNLTANLGFDAYRCTTVASGTNTLTLPSAVGQEGTEVSCSRSDVTNGTFSVIPFGSETINGLSTLDLLGKSSTTLVSQSNNWSIRNQNNPLVAGNLTYVDSKWGSDATGLIGREDLPFATLGAALTASASASGSCIIVRAGVYPLTTGLTLPAGVSVQGVSVTDTVFTMLSVTASVTMFTMGLNSSLSNMTMQMSSTTNAVNLVAIAFPTTTAASARISFLNVSIDLSGGIAGNTLIGTGIYVTSTFTSTNRSWLNAVNCNINVLGAGGGAKRALLLDTGAGNFSVEDGQFVAIQVVAATGAGTYGGVECNSSTGVITLRGCQCQGSLIGAPGAATAFDISQTLGSIEISSNVTFLGTNATTALNSANSLPFTTVCGSSSSLINTMVFAAIHGAVAARYPGIGTLTIATVANATESLAQIRFSRPTVVRNLVVRYGTLPTAGSTITIAISKNANIVTRPLSVVITNASPAAPGPVSDLARSVAFSTTDLLAISVANNSALTGFANYRITFEVY